MTSKKNEDIKKETKADELIYLKKIGERLKYFRKRAGYTNSEYFAYENNISRPQYGKYEAGANIQLNTLIKILKAMNVSLEEFFTGFNEY
ncbi:Helix-turn-helix domain protein [Flavobacterium anhuiense]|uniref:Helix-turn-helix domain protein n=1 Tax=Flavobacterium anhuiense TaxID=459526 RepID=A0A444W0R7_9FLAO|nr:helix-turn-helix transcriptional regulator [Flavobacterium anhuiense]RYJ39312.1 Helix-turn-helix domain protein [Flavobacterium anhuiense]